MTPDHHACFANANDTIAGDRKKKNGNKRLLLIRVYTTILLCIHNAHSVQRLLKAPSLMYRTPPSVRSPPLLLSLGHRPMAMRMRVRMWMTVWKPMWWTMYMPSMWRWRRWERRVPHLSRRGKWVHVRMTDRVLDHVHAHCHERRLLHHSRMRTGRRQCQGTSMALNDQGRRRRRRACRMARRRRVRCSVASRRVSAVRSTGGCRLLCFLVCQGVPPFLHRTLHFAVCPATCCLVSASRKAGTCGERGNLRLME